MNPLSVRRGSRPDRRRVRTLMVVIGISILVITTGSFLGGVLHLENPNGDRIDVVISPQRAIQTSRTTLARDRPGPPTLGGEGGPEMVAKLFQPSDLKLPTPILVMGLMKAGTTSIYGYFRCGLDPKTSKLSHYDCKPTSTDPQKIGTWGICWKIPRCSHVQFWIFLTLVPSLIGIRSIRNVVREAYPT
jgi:hypothetical protein